MRPQDSTTKQRKTWDARAADKGASLAGVLYRGLPARLNEYLHDFHVRIVTEELLPRIPSNGQLLDVGCGYGRIAESIREVRPDVAVIGADFSSTYCRMYAARVGQPAVCADINAMPLRPGSLDGLIAITSLMYIDKDRRGDVIASLNGLLKPGGHALYIDPGHEFTRLTAAIKPSTTTTPTRGSWFRAAEYRRLGTLGTKLVNFGGTPGFSTLLPLLYALARSTWPFEKIARVSSVCDRRFGKLWKYSIHRWMLVQRN
jgi:SAM-dependent methyltransferase